MCKLSTKIKSVYITTVKTLYCSTASPSGHHVLHGQWWTYRNRFTFFRNGRFTAKSTSQSEWRMMSVITEALSRKREILSESVLWVVHCDYVLNLKFKNFFLKLVDAYNRWIFDKWHFHFCNFYSNCLV